MFIHTYPDRSRPGWTIAAFMYPDSLLTEMVQWCIDVYGKDHDWYNDVRYGQVSFEKDEDLAIFLLRWS